jgi:hypothetical protein
MTEHRARKTRWPKGRLRALAWGTGGAAFIMAAAPLVAAPKPPVDQAAKQTHKAPQRQVIERHITRRVIIVAPATPTETSGGSGYTGSYSGGSSSSSSGGSTYQPPPAPPPPPPTTTTGGS